MGGDSGGDDGLSMSEEEGKEVMAAVVEEMAGCRCIGWCPSLF
jgi:hypothetical protein